MYIRSLQYWLAYVLYITIYPEQKYIILNIKINEQGDLYSLHDLESSENFDFS